MSFLTWARLQWDRLGAWICIGAGALVLLLGYIGVSGTAYTAEQLPYIVSGGLTGIFLLGVGGMLWLSADLRDEWRKLDDLDRTLLTHRLVPIDESAPAPPRASDGDLPTGPIPRPSRTSRRSRTTAGPA
jgi:hypothetical protein